MTSPAAAGAETGWRGSFDAHGQVQVSVRVGEDGTCRVLVRRVLARPGEEHAVLLTGEFVSPALLQLAELRAERDQLVESNGWLVKDRDDLLAERERLAGRVQFAVEAASLNERVLREDVADLMRRLAEVTAERDRLARRAVQVRHMLGGDTTSVSGNAVKLAVLAHLGPAS